MAHWLLKQTEHRAFSTPDRPWVAKQEWSDLLFLNYPIPVETLQTLLPDGMEVDSFDGQGWVSIVPFYLKLAPRGFPENVWPVQFAELNVRTYVTINGHPAVYFFSLDCPDPVSVWGARTWFNLPYFRATTSLNKIDETVTLMSTRKQGPQPSDFSGRYAPVGEPFFSEAGSLEAFLTNRWSFFTPHPRKPQHFYQGDIHHEAWPLQKANVELDQNSLFEGHQLNRSNSYHSAWYASKVHVLTWNRSVVTLKGSLFE